MEKNMCNFRPKNSYEAEFGCPLDHCSYCGDHDHEDAPCREKQVCVRHDAWRDAAVDAAFENWWRQRCTDPKGGEQYDPFVKAIAREAFDFGFEGFTCEQNGLTMGDCGQKDCYACHPDPPDPLGYADSIE